jgi:hypothetical protein
MANNRNQSRSDLAVILEAAVRVLRVHFGATALRIDGRLWEIEALAEVLARNLEAMRATDAARQALAAAIEHERALYDGEVRQLLAAIRSHARTMFGKASVVLVELCSVSRRASLHVGDTSEPD